MIHGPNTPDTRANPPQQCLWQTLLVDPSTFQTEFGYGFIIQALPKAKSGLEKGNQSPP